MKTLKCSLEAIRETVTAYDFGVCRRELFPLIRKEWWKHISPLAEPEIRISEGKIAIRKISRRSENHQSVKKLIKARSIGPGLPRKIVTEPFPDFYLKKWEKKKKMMKKVNQSERNARFKNAPSSLALCEATRATNMFLRLFFIILPAENRESGHGQYFVSSSHKPLRELRI